ncbi:hypothetical protein GCM10018966_051970 [Streptomyces yanii]
MVCTTGGIRRSTAEVGLLAPKEALSAMSTDNAKGPTVESTSDASTETDLPAPEVEHADGRRAGV